MIEYTCDKCCGKGILEIQVENIELLDWGVKVFQPGPVSTKICPLCKGAGKLNWIENVLGKDDPVLDKFSVFNKTLSIVDVLTLYKNLWIERFEWWRVDIPWLDVKHWWL